MVKLGNRHFLPFHCSNLGDSENQQLEKRHCMLSGHWLKRKLYTSLFLKRLSKLAVRKSLCQKIDTLKKASNYSLVLKQISLIRESFFCFRRSVFNVNVVNVSTFVMLGIIKP